jgi:hypothetical protein
MAEYARVDGDAILEIRDLEVPPPPHKAYLWRPVVIEGDGPLVSHVIESDRVRRVKSERPLDEVKAELIVRVDADAEAVRLKYITGGVGQAMTYQEKKDQALAVLQMGETDANALANNGAVEFPTLSASVPLEAPNLYAAAQLVIGKYEQWAALSRVIETTRLAGKKSIIDASDVAAARAAYEAIAWTL